jgi:(hydroxyamino)benzene mutase
MHPTAAQYRTGHRLIQFGLVLFLLGLLVGFAVPYVANPRMGLASHVEGVMNGMLLMLLGLIWPRLVLPSRTLGVAFGLAVYGTFANWSATLLAAVWGAGRSMPLAAPAPVATGLQENVIDFLLISLSVAIIAVTLIVLYGLRQAPGPASHSERAVSDVEGNPQLVHAGVPGEAGHGDG